MAVPKRKTTKSRSGKEDLISNFHQKILLKIKNLVNIGYLITLISRQELTKVDRF